jgi:mono/diheme cytochrome c family protein
MSKKKDKQQKQQARQVSRDVTSAPARVSSSLVPASASGAAMLEEGPEPTAGDVAVPTVLLALLALLIYVADVHLINRGGQFDSKVYYPFISVADVGDAHPISKDEELVRKGKQVYNLNCAACHQGNGQGIPGQFPPLAGSEWVTAEGPGRTIRIVLSAVAGPIDVAGSHFDSTAMPPWKPTLTDEQVAAVVTYVRHDWGNKRGAATPEQVKKIRDIDKDRGPYTADEIKAVPEKE